MRNYLNNGHEISKITAQYVGESNAMTKVLVVRPDAIGDFIIWLNAARKIRQIYPKGKFHIVLLGNSAWVELAERLDYWDEVWPLDRQQCVSDLSYQCSLFNRVRRYSFDIVLYPVLNREFICGDLFVLWSGAKERIGFKGDSVGRIPLLRFLGNSFFTRLIDIDNVKYIWEGHKNDYFVRQLGTVENGGDFCLPAALLDESKAPVGSYVVVFLGGGTPSARTWPLENFIQIIERVMNNEVFSVVICGGQKEKTSAAVVKDKCNNVIDLVGQLSLKQLAGVIKNARYVLSSDTVAVHMAAALNVSSICILGGGHPGRFLPYPQGVVGVTPRIVRYQMPCYGCSWKCRYPVDAKGSFLCIRNVSVQEIWDEINIQ